MLRVEGAVRRPLELRWEDLEQLPGQVADVAERLPGRRGAAVELTALLEHAGALPEASRLTVESADGSYSGSVALEEAREGLVVYRLGAEPLPEALGGPVRFFLHAAEECRGHGDDPCLNVKDLGTLRLS